MTRSFFDLYGHATPAAPQYLILDTREKIQPILKAIAKIPGLTWEDSDVVERVLGAIQYERSALNQLHNQCLEVVSQATGVKHYNACVVSGGAQRLAVSWHREESPATVVVDTHWVNEATQLANLLLELGAHLYGQLRMLGCYQHGYLGYRFKEWNGIDMVLARFQPLPRKVDDHRLDPLSADADLAYNGAANRLHQ